MIAADHVSVCVNDKEILSDISLTLEGGRITAILGPNGAGKSTLLKCLAGSLKPSAGTVMLAGQALKHYSLNALARKRAMLTQVAAINFPFTVLEIVMMGRNPYIHGSEGKRDFDIVEAVLKKMDVWDLRDRIFPTLSGGEQQRVQLARIFAQIWEQDQAVIFLDEPTSALDLKHQYQLLEFIRVLAQRGYVIGVILHDLNLAMHYTDHAHLLSEGRLVATGKTVDVLTKENIKRCYGIDVEIIDDNTHKTRFILSANPKSAEDFTTK